jgi:hypothetical protein
VLITAGILALGGLLVAAYKKFDKFRAIVDTVFGVFKAIGTWVAENWQLVIAILLGPIGILIGNFRSLRDIAVKVFETIGDAIDKILGPLSKVIDGVGKVAGAVTGGVGKVSGGVKKVFGFAQGGIVTRPTLAMVGEGGEPEFIIPASKMPDMLSAYGSGMAQGAVGGTSVVINVNGGDPQAVVDALRRYMQINGSVPIRVS